MEDRRILVPELSKAQHCYTLEGVPLVSVTAIIGQTLRAPGLEAWFKRTTREEAERIANETADFGHRVHAALCAHARGVPLVSVGGMPEAWERAVTAGKKWIDENIEEVYASEQPIASAKYGYAGTPDLYGRRIGRKLPVIVDFKTSPKLYWEHRFQTAGYQQACQESYGDPRAERMVLVVPRELPKWSEPCRAYSLNQHEMDWAGFGHLLGVYRILQTELEA